MNIEVLEDQKDKLRIELKDEGMTLASLVSKQVWVEGGEAAALKEHPFMAETRILVKGSNPRKLLEKSATAIEEKCDELEAAFKKALQR